MNWTPRRTTLPGPWRRPINLRFRRRASAVLLLTGGALLFPTPSLHGQLLPVPTTVTVTGPVTGTYGGTVSLSANLSGPLGPLIDQPITFTLNGAPVGTVNTDLNGTATIPAATLAGINAGVYPQGVGAMFPGAPLFWESSSGTSDLQVDMATPVITWANPADIVYTTPLGAAELNATADVLGTFVYTPAAGAILGAGAGQTLSADFTPTDSANYNSVIGTTVAINVLKGTPVITWAPPADIVYPTPLGPGQLNAAASVPGTFVYTPAVGTILGAGAGQTLSANFTPTDSANYNSVIGTTVAINVLKGTPVITWAPPADIVYPTPLGPVQLNAAASVPGTFAYTPGAGAIPVAGTGVILSADFTPTDTANYDSVVTNVPISVLKGTPVVTWAPADVVYPAPLGPGQLNAVADTPGTFVYTPTAGTVLGVGAGQTLSADFTPTDSANYNGVAGTTVSIDVVKGTPVITWATPADITYPMPLGPAQLNATADVPGVFVYTPAAGVILMAGAGQTLSADFTPTDTANYNSVAGATASINVLKGTPVVTWAPPADITYPMPLGPAELNATADVPGAFAYTPVAGTVLGGGAGQTLSAAFTPTDSANYNAVPATTVPITVRRGTPVITWAPPNAIIVGTPLGALQLNATTNSDGMVTFIPPAGTLLDVGTHTLRVHAAETANYEAADAQVPISVLPATAIAISGSLSDGTVGGAYSVFLTAVGGVPPYRWSIAGGALPSGLSLDVLTGEINGTPDAAGTSTFTVGVSDSGAPPTTASAALSIVVTEPVGPPQPFSLVGLSGVVNPADQFSIGLNLSSPQSVALSGTLTVAFEPNASAGGDDPMVRFSNGTRTASFQVQPGSTTAIFTPPVALLTGTVAGTLRFTVSTDGGSNTMEVGSATIPRLAPQITSATPERTNGGLAVRVVGYSTGRQVTRITFDFNVRTASGIQQVSLARNVTTQFDAWYQSAPAASFGSAFLFSQAFTVQGDTSAIESVAIGIVNDQGMTTSGQVPITSP